MSSPFEESSLRPHYLNSIKFLLLWGGAVIGTTAASAEDAVVFAPLSVADAKAKAVAWVGERAESDEQLREAIDSVWQFEESTSTVDERFNAVMQTFYLANESVRELVDACLQRPVWMLPSSFAALESGSGDAFYENNVKQFYARYLAVGGAYDQALVLFQQIDPAELVDPASSLFYRAVCEHGLLLKEEGLQTIETLLEHTEELPERYRAVATLMQADLEQLREKSLGEVARQMKDVHRRLSLGHGGQRVQEVEEKIIATLDELIEKMESQQGSSSSSSANGQGSPSQGNQSDQGLKDSRIAGGTGPGEVDPKDLGNDDKWGGLPDKAETNAKNLINRQFPQHYRQAVEEYLRKLAERTAPQR